MLKHLRKKKTNNIIYVARAFCGKTQRYPFGYGAASMSSSIKLARWSSRSLSFFLSFLNYLTQQLSLRRRHWQWSVSTRDWLQLPLCCAVTLGWSCLPTCQGQSQTIILLLPSQLYLWGSPFWVRFFRTWPFLNPTIEVVTFCLRGWCMLGVFLVLASTHLWHECQIFWVCAMECMCAQTRPRFILSSDRVLGGMESEPMLSWREKSPLPKHSPQRKEPTALHQAGQRAQHTTSDLFWPPNHKYFNGLDNTWWQHGED